ncbi:alcohol dehydrogenase catalytic domain-containing protein [Klenkia sp. LSe6-5]|uniref:Alcohol dehydrogenase catalytic domain-containing protein n=1 Tax=Klenkia sesuvii TaxID=3103137 RepID=A0ABU8DWG1_9ACTN
MKAVVFHDVGDVRVDDVPDPAIQQPTDAVVRLTGTALCGTDLHFVRGSMGGMRPGTVLGHEGVGVVEEVGSGVRNLAPGDRVVIGSTVSCGACSYCRAGYTAQCDRANPNGPLAGTSFFGGPETTGPVDGMQAELVRVPFAHTTAVRIPDEVADDDALLVSDILPTAWFGAELAGTHHGSTVAVFGAGPVGLMAVASAQLQGAGRVLCVDREPDRLTRARDLGAETVDLAGEDVVEVLRDLTGGAGPDAVIDAVGVDAVGPDGQPDATSATELELAAVAKAGTVSLIGVYPPEVQQFAIGQAMNKNLTLRMGNCNHHRYIPDLLRRVRTGEIAPARIISQDMDLTDAVEAYRTFDQHGRGWQKVVFDPSA